MNARLFNLQKQVALTLVEKLEHQEISWERAGEIAQIARSLLPDLLPEEQVDSVLSMIVKIPELSSINQMFRTV